MTVMTHEGPTPWWRDALDMWASLAITAIWVAVSLTAIFGPDMRFQSNDGSATAIPSAVAVGLFAIFATKAVARYGFGRDR
jgi:hypothetical protein